MSMYEETESNDKRECPYCGNREEVEPEEYSEDERIEECDACGKKYFACESYSVTHCAMPDCELNGGKHEWHHPCNSFWKECRVCEKYKRVSEYAKPTEETP